MSEPRLPAAAEIFVSFVTLLRLNGFAVAPEQTVTFLAAIELLGPRGIDDVHRAGLATLAPPSNPPFTALPHALEPHVAQHERLSVRESSNREQRSPAFAYLPHHGKVVLVGPRSIRRYLECVTKVL